MSTFSVIESSGATEDAPHPCGSRPGPSGPKVRVVAKGVASVRLRHTGDWESEVSNVYLVSIDDDTPDSPRPFRETPSLGEPGSHKLTRTSSGRPSGAVGSPSAFVRGTLATEVTRGPWVLPRCTRCGY